MGDSMVLRSFGDKRPILGSDVYVDDAAVVIGEVHLHDGSSVWPGAVIRADDASVDVGRGSAMMDMSFAEAPKGRPVVVGDGCVVSHGARLHGCSIGEESLVGLGAMILDGAIIGACSVVAAGSLVPPGTKIPLESFIMGTPARIIRQTNSSDLTWLRDELRLIAAKKNVYRSTSQPYI
jgi:carbonic anhydrase/acetyltransferase-like protein (isoleucine patch superfamily)